MTLNYSKSTCPLWASQRSNEAELCQKDGNFCISSGSWSGQWLHSTLYQLQFLPSAEDFQKHCVFSDMSPYNSSAEHFLDGCSCEVPVRTPREMHNTLVIWPPKWERSHIPKTFNWKREKKYGEKVKKTVSVLMVNAPRKGEQHLLRFKYPCSSGGGGGGSISKRKRAFPGNIPAVLFSNSCSRSFCPSAFFDTSFESTAEKARNTQITWAIDVNP